MPVLALGSSKAAVRLTTEPGSAVDAVQAYILAVVDLFILN